MTNPHQSSLPSIKAGFFTSFTQLLSNDRLGLVLALLVGGFIRFYAPLTHDFPLGDGGLFVVMAQTIKANHFVLPSTIVYPTVGQGIPMCYPPLSFYEVALLNGLGVPIETSLRLLPALASTACIYAFWRVARLLYAPWPAEAERAANVAALLWALLPWSFVWLIMGGGITRAPGLFWVLMGIEAGIALWRDKKNSLFWLTFCLAAAILTHLQQARFLFVSLPLLAVIYGRSWRSLGQWLLSFVLAVLLTLPWWGLCLSRFGLAPFSASLQSGSSAWGGAGLWKTVLGAELVIPVITVAGLIGLLILKKKLPLLPLWVVLILLVEVRSPRLFLTIPLALAAGLALFQIKPFLWRSSAVALLASWGIFQCMMIVSRYKVLPPTHREAMSWVQTHVPPPARFLVVPANMMRKDWASDLDAEWFPVLSGRRSVITVQGSEWLPNHTFRRLWDHYIAFAKTNDWPSFKAQIQKRNVQFDYLFLPQSATAAPENTKFLRKVETGLQRDHGFSRVFSNSDVSVWKRNIKTQ